MKSASAMLTSTLIWCARASGEASPTVFFSAMVPCRVIAAGARQDGFEKGRLAARERADQCDAPGPGYSAAVCHGLALPSWLIVVRLARPEPRRRVISANASQGKARLARPTRQGLPCNERRSDGFAGRRRRLSQSPAAERLEEQGRRPRACSIRRHGRRDACVPTVGVTSPGSSTLQTSPRR